MGYGMDEDWGGLADEEADYQDGQAYFDRLSRAEKLYNKAKDAETGCTIACPWCEKLILKKTYHKIFCSNQKTNGKNNCKDHYWNNISDHRRENGQLISQGIIPGTKRAYRLLNEWDLEREIRENS